MNIATSNSVSSPFYLTNTQLNNAYQNNISEQAAQFLKLTVNNCWEKGEQHNANYFFINGEDKENFNNQNRAQG